MSAALNGRDLSDATLYAYDPNLLAVRMLTVDDFAGGSPSSGGLTNTELRASAVPVSLSSVPSHAVTNAGTFAVQAATTETRPATSTVTSVSASATSVTIKASNANRVGLAIFNDSDKALYVKHGATASATDYTVKILAAGYYELPRPVYSGVVDGIWEAAPTGAARVTETT